MKNKIVYFICIALVILGAVACHFAKIEAVQATAFAVTMFSAGLAVSKLWAERKGTTPTWLLVLSLVLTGVGAFVAGVTGVLAEEQITQIIGYVFSIIAIIAGIVVAFIKPKTEVAKVSQSKKKA